MRDKIEPAGYQQTAEFFERAASKCRWDSPRRERLIESAKFYRSLAAILPGPPPGFREPPYNGNRWLNRAEECRTLAERMSDPESRRQLILLAENYDRLALLDR